jgi:type II secretory pathway component GspD/PulD (secretin)
MIFIPFGQEKAATGGSGKSPVVTKLANPRLRSPITLWAKDANLSEVLKVLSEKSEMNFVAGEGVYREKITIILNKTPLDEAINLLVRAAGLSYEIIGNSVLIAEPANLKEEIGQMGYVVELKYVPAQEVAEMLADLSKNIKVDAGGNRLICFTSPRVILEIEKLVREIDHPHILVMLETRLIEVGTDRLAEYGIDWGNLSPIQSGIGYPESPLKEGFKPDKWVKLPLDFDLALDMLVSDGVARVLMDSKLTTTNNREAKLHIGEVIPYLVQAYNFGGAGAAAGGGANLQIQKEEVGVKVAMTPHVNEENQITLTLEPEVSTVIGYKGKDADLPVVKVRKANTTVRVSNGQTIFLAGLLSEEKTAEIRKLPVLGDIPLIGLLFQNRKDVIKKSNLIIEITPKIIRDPAELSYGSGSTKEMEKQSDTMKESMETEEEGK